MPKSKDWLKKEATANVSGIILEVSSKARDIKDFGGTQTITTYASKVKIEKIDERITEYVNLLAAHDEEEEGQGGTEEPGLAEKLEQITEKREQCEELLKEIPTQDLGTPASLKESQATSA